MALGEASPSTMSDVTLVDAEWSARGRVRERALAHEVQGMAGLCKRLRFRMQWELRASHAEHKLRHPDCGPLDGPVPGEEFRETFKIYTTGVLGLLREQRERAAMALASLKGKESGRPISDQEYQAELASLAKDAIRAMPRRELEALLKERVDLGKPEDKRRGPRHPGSAR